MSRDLSSEMVDKQDARARLQAKIDALEGRTPCLEAHFDGTPAAWTFGEQSVDNSLHGGTLNPQALHEVVPASHPDGPAALAFTVALCRRRGAGKPVLWVLDGAAARTWGRPSAAGLRHLGLAPERVVLVRVKRREAALWAMEEAAAAGELSAVVGDVDDADLTQSRRLTLAAEEGRTPVLLIRGHAAPSVARTRWAVGARPSAGLPFDPRAPGRPRWSVRLEKAGGGLMKRWTLEWDHDTHRFHLPRPLADRPARAHLATRRASRGHARATGA